jgi:hypothetical protein
MSSDDQSNSRPEMTLIKPIDYKVELPPSLNYQLDLATTDELKIILSRLKEGRRQTMNFRTMPTAQALVLKVAETQKIIGWQGFDHHHRPDYPEKFSLHLDEEYRSFLLGLALEHGLAVYLQKHNVPHAYVRMESSSNSSLLDWRVKTGIYKRQAISELNPEWVANCKKCELFGKKCPEQTFFQFDVNEWVEFGNRRLGIHQHISFPANVVLAKDIIRMHPSKEIRYQARWAA